MSERKDKLLSIFRKNGGRTQPISSIAIRVPTTETNADLDPQELIAGPLREKEQLLRRDLEKLDRFEANQGVFGITGAYTLVEAYGTSDKEAVRRKLQAELDIVGDFVRKINLAINAAKTPETKNVGPKQLK